MRLGHEKQKRRELGLSRGYKSLTGRDYGKPKKASRSQQKAWKQYNRTHPKYVRTVKPTPKPKKWQLTVANGPLDQHSFWIQRGNHWTCTRADPLVEWFRRVHNIKTIAAWIGINRYSYRWTNLTHTVARAASPPAASPGQEQQTAEAFPVHNPASGPFHANSSPSLNSTLPREHCTSSASCVRSGAEWVNHSSPLNHSGMTRNTEDQALAAP